MELAAYLENDSILTCWCCPGKMHSSTVEDRRAGTGSRYEKVAKAIDKQISIKNLDFIIPARIHFDHIGGANKIARVLKSTFQKTIAAKEGVATAARSFLAKVPELELNFLIAEKFRNNRT